MIFRCARLSVDLAGGLAKGDSARGTEHAQGGGEQVQLHAELAPSRAMPAVIEDDEDRRPGRHKDGSDQKPPAPERGTEREEQEREQKQDH